MNKQILAIASILLFIAVLLAGLMQGSSWKLIPEFAEACIHYNPDNIQHVIWINIRLPRFLLAFATGASLGLSGYLMQVLVRNPLADPYVLGSSAGSSLLAAIFFMILPPALLSLPLLLLLTFCGALGSNILSLFLSTVKGRIIPYRMILIGIAISSLAISLMSLVFYISGEDQSFKNVIFWTFGSFQSASWTAVIVMSCIVFIITFISYLLFSPFQIMELGEENASRIGVSVHRYRIILLGLSSVLTAAAVSMAGPIGFIGLIMPHLLRMLFRFKLTAQYVIWLSVCSGLFLLVCEISSGLFFPPQGIPAGILMAIIGVPFFLLLILRSHEKNV